VVSLDSFPASSLQYCRFFLKKSKFNNRNFYTLLGINKSLKIKIEKHGENSNDEKVNKSCIAIIVSFVSQLVLKLQSNIENI
jgi:hypothetical protein